MHRLRLTPRALADMRRLPAFLRINSPKAAEDARATLVHALESLRVFPDRGRPGGVSGGRELVVPFGRDAYIFRYRTRGDEVVVANIRHSRERR